MADESKTTMPLWAHLDELRKALIRLLVVLGVSTCVTYQYSDQIVYFLEKPLLDILPEGEKFLYFTGIADKFVIYFKISILASLFLTCPYLLFEIWRFIAPGLYGKEKKFAIPFMFLGTVSFFLGSAFAYYIIVPFGYEFLIQFGSPTDKAIITLTEYFDITIKLILAVGLVFEMPVVLMLLGKLGLVSSAWLKSQRRSAFIAISVISALATPSPDAFTMFLVMVPLWMLFELSIVLVKWVQPS